MLTKCANCDFYVQQTDEFCLNCGFEKPAVQISSQFNFGLLVLIDVILIIAFSIIGILLTLSKYQEANLAIILSISILISTIFSFGFGYLFYEWRRNTNLWERKSNNNNNLEGKKKVIEKRLSELNRRGIKIDGVLDKIKQDDSQQLQQVREKLISAREIVIGQIARYELQRKKIHLARLQNEVSPYVNRIHKLNESEMDKGLTAIEITKHELEKIRFNLTSYYAIEFPRSVQADKENFLLQIEDTEESCDKIREAFVSQQATRALRGISPIEDTLKMPSSKEIAHAVDTFNIQSTLTDFSESFEELENEYRRVRSESEVSNNLLNDIDQ